MKTYIQLPHERTTALPVEFADHDVRYPDALVRLFLEEYTRPGDLILDPFAGFGTTLRVAEEMGRRICGLEYDRSRWVYARSQLRHADALLLGDARQLGAYGFPPIDFSLTSPPYASRGDECDPFTGYTAESRGYDAYLTDIQAIYGQLGLLMTPDAVAVVEVANLKDADGITTLAWDVARAIGQVLTFEGEVVVGWTPTYGCGYDHSYCLVFTKPSP